MDCRHVPASPSGQSIAGHLSPFGSNQLSVLVTGSSGFIGTHVVRHLHAAGHRVTGLDHIPPKDPLPNGVAFHVCDIRQGELPDRTFDAVVHLAALAGVRPSMDRPMEYESTNVIGTIRLLEFCRRMGVPRFVFASSSSVYGPDTPLPAEESTPANPCSPYALTKLHGRVGRDGLGAPTCPTGWAARRHGALLAQ